MIKETTKKTPKTNKKTSAKNKKKTTKKNVKTKRKLKKNIKILSVILICLLILLCLIFILIHKSPKKINNYNDLEKLETTGELITEDIDLEDSGITGEDYVIDENNIYYSLLTEDEQKLYRQIYANIKNLKETFIPIIEIDCNNILRIYQAVTYDNPDLFWLSNGYTYKYKENNVCKQITLRYNGLQYEYEENKKLFDDSVNIIIEEAKKLNSDYEKEKYVFETLIKKATYDLNSYYNQTAYSALVNGKTVCAGYSKAFQYIMNKLGIITYYIEGTADLENHAWNIVKLDDGYYNVDLTWEEMNVNDEYFSSTHERSEFSRLLPVSNGTNYLKKNKNNIKNNSNNQFSKTQSTKTKSDNQISNTTEKTNETSNTTENINTNVVDTQTNVNNQSSSVNTQNTNVNDDTSKEQVSEQTVSKTNELDTMSNNQTDVSNSQNESSVNEQSIIDNVELIDNLVEEENNSSNNEELINDDEFGKVVDVTEQETDTSNNNSHNKMHFRKR